jgi:hypothetical protein
MVRFVYVKWRRRVFVLDYVAFDKTNSHFQLSQSQTHFLNYIYAFLNLDIWYLEQCA